MLITVFMKLIQRKGSAVPLFNKLIQKELTSSNGIYILLLFFIFDFLYFL